MFTPIQLLLSAQRHHKRMITLLYDVFALIFSLYAAIALRLDTLAFTFNFQEFLSMMITVGSLSTALSDSVCMAQCYVI